MLNDSVIAESIISKLGSIGISSYLGADETQTSKLVRLIVREIIIGLKRDGVVQTTVVTTGNAITQAGTGVGNVT